MKTRKLILTRGIQGSGKSTWAKQWCHEDPEHRVRFNNDDIRNMLGDYWVPNRENLVKELKNTFAKASMLSGKDIIIDNMNLNPKEIEYWEGLVEYNNDYYTGRRGENPPQYQAKYFYELEFKDFFIPVEECIRRDAMRPNPIGEKVIKATWRRYRDFIIQEDIKNMLKRNPKHVDGGSLAILVDMDATLCLNTSGRPFYGEGAAENMWSDTQIDGTCALVKAMYEKCKVFIVTGREGTPEIIESTKKWLERHDIKVDELFFRPVGDYSPGPDCKRRIYEENIKGKYNVQFVLDDSSKCVKMWREQGLICLQPNEGKF